MIEGRSIAGVEENSRWEAELGPGVELAVQLDEGPELFVIQTGLRDVDEELETWRGERVGQQIEEVDEIVSLPLETGGKQVTLEITLEGGFTFEADLIRGAERVETDEESLETEWTFEGVPGVEMGETMDTQDTEEPGV